MEAAVLYHLELVSGQSHTYTDRQADRQAGRQTDRQTDRQADRQAGRHTHRQTDRQTDKMVTLLPDQPVLTLTTNTAPRPVVLPDQSRSQSLSQSRSHR